MSNETGSSPSFLRKSSTYSAGEPLSALGRLLTGRPIEPSASWYRRWWFFTTLCALATAFFTPWEIAFTEEPGLSPFIDAPAVVEYVLTSVFVMDIFIHLNVAFINAEGKIEIGRRAIATNYLKLMFWIDLLGVIPVSTLVGLFVDTDRNHRILSFLRLFRLVRAHRLWALSRDFEMNIHLHLTAITLVRNFTIVLVANHCAACVFYYLARLYGFDQDTWIGANLSVLEGEEGALPNWHKYVYSLYWAVTTMTTVGYGDFSPKNISEVIFTMLFMLFNIALNSYILGTITLVVIKADETTSRQRRGHEKLDRFAHKHRLTTETLWNLNNHLKFNYLHPEIHDSELLVNLPSNLRRKVMNELYGGRLRKSPLFKGCSKGFIASLLEPYEDINRQTVHVEIYMTDDEIVTMNEYASCLCVILSGDAQLERCLLSEFDAFPVELFLDVPDASDGLTDFQTSRYTVRATSTCRILCIPRKTLLRSFRAYPGDRDIFRRAAMEYTQRYRSMGGGSSLYMGDFDPLPPPMLQKTSHVHFSDEQDHEIGWPDLEANEVSFASEFKADSEDMHEEAMPSTPHSSSDADADASLAFSE